MPEKGAFDNLTEANRQPAGRIQLAGGYRKLPEKGMICKSAGRRPAASSWLVVIENIRVKAGRQRRLTSGACRGLAGGDSLERGVGAGYGPVGG